MVTVHYSLWAKCIQLWPLNPLKYTKTHTSYGKFLYFYQLEKEGSIFKQACALHYMCEKYKIFLTKCVVDLSQHKSSNKNYVSYAVVFKKWSQSTQSYNIVCAKSHDIR